MKSYNVTVVDVSNLTAEFNKWYGTRFDWCDMNELLFWNKSVSGIRSFYFGKDVEYEDEIMNEICTFFAKKFPGLEVIYIDTEA